MNSLLLADYLRRNRGEIKSRHTASRERANRTRRKNAVGSEARARQRARTLRCDRHDASWRGAADQHLLSGNRGRERGAQPVSAAA